MHAWKVTATSIRTSETLTIEVDADDPAEALDNAVRTLAENETPQNTDPDDRAGQVRLFLAEQLDRDDMTLAEIAAGAVSIATGASEYEPADDEDENEDYDTSSLAKEDARNAWQHQGLS